MKKGPSFLVILGFLILIFAAPAYSWQGRMAGMGDPYGLLEDESDFLIHPAGIAKGQGIAFYGHYRFAWWDVKDWDYSATAFDPTTGSLIETWPYRGSGDEQEHDGLLGGVFPLGSGRMGLFFEYLGKRGDFDGDANERSPTVSQYHLYQFENDLDSFALRLLYGFPMGGFKLGGETQLAYRCEENETFFNEDLLFGNRAFLTNWPFGAAFEWRNLFPFMFPYDSKYWEALFKGSLSGSVGVGEFAFTVRGGFIFAGDNKLEHSIPYSILGTGMIDMDGDVKGWRIGGDLWVRSPLREYISLPILLKLDYWEKTRDGDAMGTGTYAGGSFDYENRRRVFQVEAGGGLDIELNKGARIAAGIYYNYIENKNDFVVNAVGLLAPGLFRIYDHSNYPDNREHRVILRLLGESEPSPQITMRMGLNCFYGWVKEHFNFNYSVSPLPPVRFFSDASLDGHHWGIGASLGGTVKFNRFSLEPFIGGGYENLNLDGDGFDGFPDAPVEWDKKRKEWLIGGGFSIKF